MTTLFFDLYFRDSPALQDAEESQYIVQVGNDKQKNQNAETNILSTLHELIARFATCDNLIEKEEHMSTIKSRDRKNVHEGKNNAQERCHKPECMPIPYRWEETAQRTETTQTLGTFLREDILHIAHITGQDIPAVFDAGRETLEEAIVDMSNLIIEQDRMIVETKLHTLFGRLQENTRLDGIARSLEISNLSCKCSGTILRRFSEASTSSTLPNSI